MGNLGQQNGSFQWQKQFEILQYNIHDQYLLLRSLQTNQEFIGKEISCYSQSQKNQVQSLIGSKISRSCQYITKLMWSSKSKGLQYCSYQTKYYLQFQKYYLNLKQYKINRQFKCESFSQNQVLEVLQSIMKALLFLKKIGQSHQRVCLQNIYIKDDKSIVLSDPWLFPKDYTSIFNFHLNGFIYPSPQKILYQNDMIEDYDMYVSDYYSLGVLLLQLLYMQQMDIIYEKGFRRILEENIKSKINMVALQQLKLKLKILLSYDPQQRKKIEKFYGKQTSETQMCFFNQRNSHQFPPQQIFAKKDAIRIQKIQPKTENAKLISKQVDKTSNNQSSIPIILKKQIQTHVFPQGNINNKPKIHFSYSQQNNFRPIIQYQLVQQQPKVEKRQMVSSGTNTSPFTNLVQNKAQQVTSQPKQQKQVAQEVRQSFNNDQIKISAQSQVNSSLNQMNSITVKNSLSEQNQNQLTLKKINQIRHFFKEVVSLNASEDRSQRVSEVIGHGFSTLSQQNGLGHSNNAEVNGRGSLPSYSRKESLDRYTNRESKSCANLQDFKNYELSSDCIAHSIQSIPNQKKLQAPAVTPERSHFPSKKHNSTIKQVSQDQNSISSYDNEYDERTVEYDVGTKYIGQIKNGKRNGRGLFYYNDGSYYEGYWRDNKMHGKGSLYYSNGSLAYDGNWYMDNFHGKGKIYNDRPKRISYPFDYKMMTNEHIQEFWEVYEGDFFYEQKHGKGKLKLANGQVYVGEFSDDKIQGEGRFYRLNGEIVSGLWSSGYMVDQI